MNSNGYQDLASILKSLTSYGTAASQRSPQSLFLSGSAVPVSYQSDHALQSWNGNSTLALERSYGYQPWVSEPTHQPSTENLMATTRPYFQHATTGPVEVLNPTMHSIPVHAPPDLPQRSITPIAKLDIAPQIDPRTITEWSIGLRYVTKLAAKNEQIVDSIRKMINVQHDHERQWWAGRKALLQKQTGRVEGKRKLDDVLRSIGGQISSGGAITDNVAELRRYDMKVYAAQTEMSTAMTAKLGAMGIPFFDTEGSLILQSKAIQPDSIENTPSMNDVSAQEHVKIAQVELVKLQQRMLQHLEDLYKD